MQRLSIDRVNDCLAVARLPTVSDFHVPGSTPRRRSAVAAALDRLERKFGLEREHWREGHRLLIGQRIAAVEAAMARAAAGEAPFSGGTYNGNRAGNPASVGQDRNDLRQ
jgi:hypothetical protein